MYNSVVLCLKLIFLLQFFLFFAKIITLLLKLSTSLWKIPQYYGVQDVICDVRSNYIYIIMIQISRQYNYSKIYMNIKLIIIQLVVTVLLHNLSFQFLFVFSLNNAEIIMFCIGQDAFLCLANKITPGISYCHTNVYDCITCNCIAY